jgi:hypothetical protein
MLFRREKLLSFYDHPVSWKSTLDGQGSHVSALTGVIGEDLVLGLLLHYWTKSQCTPRIVSYMCKGKGLRGKRLDAWIVQSPGVLFQVEVKNWSAHSLGGRSLPIDASAEELKSFAAKSWDYYFRRDQLPEEIAKVMQPMVPPADFVARDVKKLLCFWSHITDHTGKPYCTHRLGADLLYVFSASAYLRSLSSETVELKVPRIEIRLKLLKSLISEAEI